MSTPDLTTLASRLLPAVLEAGRVEMNYYDAGVTVESKSDSSPVTAADREAEAILLQALAGVAPGIPVVAEESSAAGFAPAASEMFFLVDPLDGTREFIKKNGDFTINIGLVKDGRPIFGIVYAPAMSELFFTTGTGEAMEARVAPGEQRTGLDALTLKKLASRAPDRQALVALESRSHRSKETEDFLAHYDIKETRAAGSSLKFCVIARGDADLYPRIGPTCEWDTAAAHAVLAAAGGTVTTVDGKPLSYGKAAEKYLNPHFVAWGREPLPQSR